MSSSIMVNQKPRADRRPLPLTAGIPTMAEYRRLLNSSTFREIESFSESFLRAHAFLRKQYRWVKDPFHQWSRQWEYPFVFETLAALVRRQTGAGISILDAGSGITFFPYFLKSRFHHANITCCDYDHRLCGLFERVNASTGVDMQIDFKACDLLDLPYCASTIDAIYCISVLEHTELRNLIIDEFFRVLRPGGALILTFDVALDNVSDILPEEAATLLKHAKQVFDVGDDFAFHQLDQCELATSEGVRKSGLGALPWYFPRLSLLKSALISRRKPSGWKKHLTVYGNVFRKTQAR